MASHHRPRLRHRDFAAGVAGTPGLGAANAVCKESHDHRSFLDSFAVRHDRVAARAWR